MAGNVEHVIDAACDPVVTVFVATAAVAGEVLALIGREVGFDEALVIAVKRAHLARPAVDDAEITVHRTFNDSAFIIDQFRLDAEERSCCRTWLEVGCAGQRGDENAAGFRLPPCIDNRRPLVTNDVVIPFPGFRVDRLANRTEQAQRRTRRAGDEFIAGAHQGADGRRRSVEDIDVMLVDDFPETSLIGEVGHTLEHQCRRAVGERAVDDIGVTCHPAHIRRAPVDVAVMIVEDILMRHRCIDEIAAGCVQHALRLAGGAGGVEDEERVFRIHRFRVAGRFDASNFLMIPEIAARSPAYLAAGAAHGENLVDHDILLGRNVDGGIGVFLQRNRLAAAHAFIGRDDESGFAVDDTTGKCFR